MGVSIRPSDAAGMPPDRQRDQQRLEWRQQSRRERLESHGITRDMVVEIAQRIREGDRTGYWKAVRDFVEGCLLTTPPDDLTPKQAAWQRHIPRDLEDDYDGGGWEDEWIYRG